MNNDLPNPVSFEVALTSFIEYLQNRKRSSATVTAYRSDLLQLKKYLEEHRITQATTVNTDHLRDFITHISANGYIPKSISRKINSMKTFFKFLVAEKIIGKSPAAEVIHPKVVPNAPRFLTETEYKALQDVCRLDIRMCAVVELLLQTGIRIGEVANLKMEDYRKNEMVIKPFENNSERVVPLGKNCISALQNYLAIRPDVYEQALFVTKTGRPLLVRNMRAAIDRYFRLANIKNAKVNDLRHTFASYQITQGVNPEFLAKTLGHKRDTTINRYLLFVKPGHNNFNKLVEL